MSRVRFGFFRAAKISGCEKCIYGTGEHTNFCIVESLNTIDRLLKQADIEDAEDAKRETSSERTSKEEN